MSDETVGVPRDEVTARDHIQVRAKLVKRVGGANNALVFGRIHFRADSDSRSALEIDGTWWWQASYPDIAEQTGLSPKQALDAVAALVAGGWIERRPGKGRAFLYRAVIAESYLSHRADTESDPQGTSIGPAGQTHLTSGAVVPLIDKEDVKDTPVVPTASADDLFAVAWANWPKKTEKKLSRERFLRALKKHPTLADDVCRFGIAYRGTTPVQFVPALAVWIGRERWDEPLPVGRGQQTSPTDRALATIALGREQKAVAG